DPIRSSRPEECASAEDAALVGLLDLLAAPARLVAADGSPGAVNRAYAQLMADGRPLLGEVERLDLADGRRIEIWPRGSATMPVLAAASEALEEGFAVWDANDRLVLFNRRYRDLYRDFNDLTYPGVDFAAHARARLNAPQLRMSPEEV